MNVRAHVIRGPGARPIALPDYTIPAELLAGVQADPAQLAPHASAYMAETGGHYPSAVRAAGRQLEAEYRQARARKLREVVRYWARRYATLYPALWQEDGTLLGFDPAAACGLGGGPEHPRRRGYPAAKRALAAMAAPYMHENGAKQ